MGKQAQAKKARRDRPRLLAVLQEQLEFLARSGQSFDEGFEGEAKRIAVTLRVLLHDTRSSESLLHQLGIKEKLRYFDTADVAPAGMTEAISFGLLTIGLTTGSPARYEAPLDDLPPYRLGRTCGFMPWWTNSAWVDKEHGVHWSRKRFVLTLANGEGGAHVDPELTPAYERIARYGFGWKTQANQGAWGLLPNNPALASVRQIGHEVTKTLDAHMAMLR